MIWWILGIIAFVGFISLCVKFGAVAGVVDFLSDLGDIDFFDD